MFHVSNRAVLFASVALPLALLTGEITLIGTQFRPDSISLPSFQFASVAGPDMSLPETVTLPGGYFAYRQAGSFLKNGDPVDPVSAAYEQKGQLVIATGLVTTAQYRECVAAGECKPEDARADTARNVPVTGVSFDDAQIYIAWLNKQTGQKWRLPTDQEWVYAAGSRAVDDAIGETDAEDPSERWLKTYRKSIAIDRSMGPVPQPAGTFGTNENGLTDIAGNVWEWTDTCYERMTLDQGGEVDKTVTNCGVRVVQGAHRTYISKFIRDARGGGCSAGAPPDNLGFRLVREPQWWEKINNWLGWVQQAH